MSANDDVAIIGMAGRFPGAKSVRDYWDNLCAGRESLTTFSAEEMRAVGVRPSQIANPDYVPVRGAMRGIDLFDAEFFGFTPREAELTDPQQRLFMEQTWDALETAGYNPDTYGEPIGLFAGSSLSNYFFMMNAVPAIVESAGAFQLEIGNDKDFLCTRTSYKLNLSGPSVNVNTACSTSLVAITLACQSLLTHQCDMALAGGVSIHIPEPTGYVYTKGGIMSPDGHCRAFDAGARGTVGGNGVALVVLKRLADALEDGDAIVAVIKGFALNNDGGRRVGFTAPSIDGQAAVVCEALALAGVDADTIGYVEAHGTGTSLGDPIEVEALTRAFRSFTPKRQYCALGSVKTNVGHLDSAAGVAGLIKAALAVSHGLLPPTLHYERPNPRIDFAASPFYVNATLQPWVSDGPRRAGVSSFGIGGTNAHIVLEQAPARPVGSASRPVLILPLSARTPAALRVAAANLAEHLDRASDGAGAPRDPHRLADTAYTLAVGRKNFAQRLAVVCADQAEGVAALGAIDTSPAIVRGAWSGAPCGVAMLLTGQGSQYVGMGRDLYEREPVFRQAIDRAAAYLQPLLGLDLRVVMHTGPDTLLRETWVTQPALYVLEHALLKLWASWGVEPAVLLGHSLGELVAATSAGVWDEEAGLRLVAARGRLMWATERGAMLGVRLDEREAGRYEGAGVSIAAVNGRRQVVYSGDVAAIAALRARLDADGVPARPLAVERGFHSATMEAIREPFLAELRGMTLRSPARRFLANVTGRWAGDEVREPEYWWRQMREPVRFAESVRELARAHAGPWLEVGPGNALGQLVRAELRGARPPPAVLSSLSAAPGGDQQHMAHAVAALWVQGVPFDWAAYYRDERRHRVPLPTYPYERQSYWAAIPNRVATGEIVATGETVAAGVAVPLRLPTAHHARPPPDTSFVDASTETEIAVASVWRDLLGLDRIGVADDFFALGGDSLLILQMAQRLRELLGVEIPLESFLQDPTVAGLAGAIGSHQGAGAGPSVLAPMRTTGSRPPFFAVHPIGGGSFIFRHLMHHLGSDQPFYGLQALGLADIGDAGDPFPSMEDMARTYVDAIRTVRAHGPYFLGGLSWGGVLAFEMARQLSAAGEEVRLVALLDTPAPAELSKLGALDDATMLVGLARDLGFQRGIALSVTVDEVRALDPEAQYVRVLDALQRAGCLSADATTRWLRRHLQGYRSRLRLVRDYAPGIYNGRLTFFRAGSLDAEMTPHLDQLNLDYHDPVSAWGRLSGEPVDLFTVPGNHSEIVFEPHVQRLAEYLSACITRGASCAA
jgi:phthiocerol/phenolphthiocerol synthesis type-I polyketide synthase E